MGLCFLSGMHLSLLVGIFCFALASSLTAILIKIAHKTHLLDRPIGRSAHSIPTPTGGGIALVLPFSLVLLFLHEIKLLGNEELTALSCGFLIALLGFADDIKPMDFRVRLPAQVGLGLVALVMLLPMAPLQIGKYAFSGEITLFILAFISLIWITNLYNFMDGIDGLAISELVFISGALVFFSAYEEDLKLGILSVSLLFSGIGFGLWNWAPAKIFLGDLGSGFLGFTIGVLALITLRAEMMSAWTWLLLIGVFACDTSATLVIRSISGFPVHEGHSSHAYQILADKLSSHSRVVILCILTNTVWLFPIAVFSHLKPNFAPVLAVMGLCPIMFVVCYLVLKFPRRDFNDR